MEKSLKHLLVVIGLTGAVHIAAVIMVLGILTFKATPPVSVVLAVLGYPVFLGLSGLVALLSLRGSLILGLVATLCAGYVLSSWIRADELLIWDSTQGILVIAGPALVQVALAGFAIWHRAREWSRP